MNASEIKLSRDAAMLEYEDGNLPEAETQLSELIQSIKVAGTLSLNYELCMCLINRATVLRSANRWREALKDLSSCEDLARGLQPFSRNMLLQQVYATSARVFATPYTSVYNVEKAREMLKAFRVSGGEGWVADELDADLDFRSQNWELAAELYTKVAEELDTQGWKRGVASCRLRAGLAYLEVSRWEDAKFEIDTAYKFFEEFGPPDQLAIAQMAVARVLSVYGNYEEAWSIANKALQETEALIRHFRNIFEQQRFVLNKVENYHTAFRIGLSVGGQEGLIRAWTIAERAKSFYLCQLMANADVKLFDGVDSGDVDRLTKIDDEVDRIESLFEIRKAGIDKDQQLQMAGQLQGLLNEKKELLGSIMKNNPRWAALRTPLPFNLVAEIEKLDPKWVPVSYFFLPKNDGAILYIFSSGSDRALYCVSTNWSMEELERLDQCRGKLQGKVSPFSVLFPTELIEKVLPQEFLDHIKPGQRILISPHDRLRAVPLHVLKTQSKNGLFEQQPVQYIPTLALLPLQKQSTDVVHTNVLLIGCEQDNFQDPRLKEVREEINSLKALWESQGSGLVKSYFVEQNNTPSQIGIPIESWSAADYLHIACHGVFPEDRPFDAALRLGADAVRASDFFRVRLRAKLISLSACALGRQSLKEADIKLQGDEWIGLYLPLFYSGAQVLLVSLWDANSQIATFLMKSLHEELSQGLSPVDAFQLALRQVAKKPQPFWANWYLVGFPS